MFHNQKPASMMVQIEGTSTDQKNHLFFIDDGVKVNQHIYLKMLKEKLIPWIDATFEEDRIVPQQNEATSHTANLFQKQCNENMVGF